MKATDEGTLRPFERKVPPVIGAAMASLTLAITGGVLIASQIGGNPSLGLPIVLIGAALVLEVVVVTMTLSIRPFAWDRFRQVFLVAFAAYLLQSLIIGWSFFRNHVPTRPLVALTSGLVVSATIVPLMIAFTVARYQAIDA